MKTILARQVEQVRACDLLPGMVTLYGPILTVEWPLGSVLFRTVDSVVSAEPLQRVPVFCRLSNDALEITAAAAAGDPIARGHRL